VELELILGGAMLRRCDMRPILDGRLEPLTDCPPRIGRSPCTPHPHGQHSRPESALKQGIAVS